MQPFFARWAAQILNAIPNLLTAIIIFVVALYLARVVSNLLRAFLHRRGVVSHVVELLAHAVTWTILAIGIIMALQRFFDVTAFLAGLGVIGFTVGFALQDVMKNFAAGIILLLQQPFRVGEAISVAGFDGTILAIDLRTTEMTTFDGRIVSIPNATILTNPIINFTRAPRRRVDLALPVAASVNMEATRRTMLNAMRNVPGAVSEPAPTVVLEKIDATSLSLAGSFWVDITKANPDSARDAALSQIQSDLEPRRMAATGMVPAAPATSAERTDGEQSD